jgi:hypothetical protein
MVPRRDLLLGAAGVVALVACGESTQETPPDLDTLLARLAAGARPDGPYRPPSTAERQSAVAAIRRVIAGNASSDDTKALAALGMRTGTGLDAATGRRYAVSASEPGAERGWGAAIADLSPCSTQLLVEVPHLRSDLHTEDLGLALFRAVPSSVLLVAGAHRRAMNGEADVAHRTDSLFHAVATDVGARGVLQIQLHGFDDASLPDKDAVVSAGAGAPGPAAEGVAQQLALLGLNVCRAWTAGCGSLEGRTNVQGQAAAAAGTAFVHLELSRTIRDDARRRSEVANALATAAAGTCRPA